MIFMREMTAACMLLGGGFIGGQRGQVARDGFAGGDEQVAQLRAGHLTPFVVGFFVLGGGIREEPGLRIGRVAKIEDFRDFTEHESQNGRDAADADAFLVEWLDAETGHASDFSMVARSWKLWSWWT